MKDEAKILVVDDDENVVLGLAAMLEDLGYSVATAMNGKKALQKLEKSDFDLVLVDLIMPELTGLELLSILKKQNSNTEVIIITGQGSIDSAVEAMKAGAYDYLTKPVEPQRLRGLVPKVLEHRNLLLSNRQLQRRLEHLTQFEELVGQSPAMQTIFRLIESVADSTANVLITGESGTGKELVARAIHRRSSRAQKPFVAVNCSAFPRDLLENELFGHEKGAFTGALNEKPGCFENAHNGTLFLDELGDMALETQAKILRALEERKFRRLGGKQEISVDVRIVAATNKDLQKALKEEQIREDLYYRLCVVEIALPPLRERLSDIPLLAEEFLRIYNEQNKKSLKGFSKKCEEIFYHYSWPGNVRELRNVIERAVVLCRENLIQPGDLPARLTGATEKDNQIAIPIGTTLYEAEKLLLQNTLQYARNNKTRTAKILDISLKTLHNKLNLYKVD